ncbi:MAG: GNAT family N-acetyltransferase [Chloroflexota bacterium]|nr:GNAT family N-acetyltransferase [Chloroflexota bacterium]
MDPITIRGARVDDFPSIIKINESGRPGVAPLDAAELATLLKESPCFYVAEAGAQVAGYLIAYTPRSTYDGEEFAWFQRRYTDFLYIDQVAVAEMMRRRHVASRLYQWAKDIALQKGLSSLVCELNIEPPNPVSRAFHANQGFVRVGVLDVQDGRRVALRRGLVGVRATWT